MFLESLEDLPEALRGNFEAVEIDGKKGFQDKESLKAFRLSENLKNEKHALQNKLGEFETRLTESEKLKAIEVEKALKAGYDKALKDGNSEEAERIKREQIEFERNKAKLEARAEVEKEFKLRELQISAKNDLADIINELNAASPAHKKLLEREIMQRQQIDEETGKIIYLDAGGSATTLDKKGLIASLRDDEVVKLLIKPSHVVENGGLANGSGGGSATTKKFNEYTGAELVELRKNNPNEYERIKKQFYS